MMPLIWVNLAIGLRNWADSVPWSWPRQGPPASLMQYLIDYAASRGIHEIFGDVMAENAAMLDLCRHLGFKITAVGREGVLGVSLDPLRR